MQNETDDGRERKNKFSFNGHSMLDDNHRKENNVVSSSMAMFHTERTQRELAEEILKFLSQKEKEIFASAMPRLQEAGTRFLDKIPSPEQLPPPAMKAQVIVERRPPW